MVAEGDTSGIGNSGNTKTNCAEGDSDKPLLNFPYHENPMMGQSFPCVDAHFNVVKEFECGSEDVSNAIRRLDFRYEPGLHSQSGMNTAEALDLLQG